MKRKQADDEPPIAETSTDLTGAIRVKPRAKLDTDSYGGGEGSGRMEGTSLAVETKENGERERAELASSAMGSDELACTVDAGGSTAAQEEEHTCVHDVAIPEGYVSLPPKPPSKEPAKKYPFTLDPFQREAIKCLEAEESVMVSAHTSAGKTVVAEYAIAMSLRNNQRVVYTSPIKALSNQKYREMCAEFMDVGLMTGDVTIAPEASCLVMTTEILRSMLYKGSEVMREIAWIIFDEVHYLRDKERGVVWEESIVMAPKSARFVFLSATVPNAREFAEWVAKVHRQPCHIVYTDFRPTPLQHYIFPGGGDGLYLVVDEKGTFRDDNFHKAIMVMGSTSSKKEGSSSRANGGDRKEQKVMQDGKSDIFKITKMIMQRQYDPVIVFSFSKKDCEGLAMQMSKLDLNDEDEKKLVQGVFWNAMDILSEDDKKLPQVTSILPLLKRGIGIHHSGLLPILKEVIEILFQEGLLKCLFATETFSIGLNMPAKTVVFTNVRKWDGGQFRWITSGEYIQMSGRAGRRGLDDRGIVILMVDEKMEPSIAKGMLRGLPDPLNSAFYLSYTLLLNQMRCEESDPEGLIRQSYRQFQADRSLPDLKRKIEEMEEELASFVIENEAEVSEFYSLKQQMTTLKQDIRDIVLAPKYALPFLQPGRLARVYCDNVKKNSGDILGEEGTAWGVIVNFEKTSSPKHQPEGMGALAMAAVTESHFLVDVLVQCTIADADRDRTGGKKLARPVPTGMQGEPAVVALPLTQIESLSSVRVYIPKDLRPLESREHVAKILREVFQRFPKGLQLLDPEEDMQVDEKPYRKAVRRLETVEGMLAAHPLSKSPTLKVALGQVMAKEELGAKIKIAKREVKSVQSLILRDELKARKRVLRRLGYTDADDIVQLKGRVACEVSSADELVITELIFNGIFKDLTVDQVVAMISCFVWGERSSTSSGRLPKLKDELAIPWNLLRDAARRVAKVAVECKMALDVEEYVNSFSADIMEVSYAWSKGAKFSELMKLTEAFEGSLIRAFRRLEEVLRQLAVAAKSFGETDLQEKFLQGSTKIKRDIVFAASLYL